MPDITNKEKVQELMKKCAEDCKAIGANTILLAFIDDPTPQACLLINSTAKRMCESAILEALDHVLYALHLDQLIKLSVNWAYLFRSGVPAKPESKVE
jgi:hypothetical protein